jgi:hypothetical protein
MAKKKQKVTSEVIEAKRWAQHWRLTTFEEEDGGEICVALEVEPKKVLHNNSNS